jgi:carbon storage regulator CsrA
MGVTMRLLTRRIGQSFTVAGVTISVKAVRGNRVRLCFDSPQGVLVSRGEIIEELNAAAEQALAETTSRLPPQAEGKRDEPGAARAPGA